MEVKVWKRAVNQYNSAFIKKPSAEGFFLSLSNV